MSELLDDLAVLISRLRQNEYAADGSIATDQSWADLILAEYYVISRKPLPRAERPVCPACGTWVCSACGYRRVKANRFVEQSCRCGSKTGEFLDTRHHSHYVYEDHLSTLEDYTKEQELW